MTEPDLPASPSSTAIVTQSRSGRVLAGALLAAVILVIAWIGQALFSQREAGNQPPPQPTAGQTPISVTALDYASLIDDENFHVLLGMAYGNAGRIDEAILHEREALRVNPRSGFALNNLGYYLFLKNSYAESATALEQALALDPRSELARNNLLQTYGKAIAAAQNDAERRGWQERQRRLSLP